MLEIWGTCWLKYEKIKKTKQNMKENLSQIIANELYKLAKLKTCEIINRLFWELGVVPKIDDKTYVSISIGKYIIAFRLFSVLCQRRSCRWKYQKLGSHLKNRYHHAKVVENARINFSISPYCTLLFSRKFFEVALAANLWNGVIGCIINVWGYRHWNIVNTTAEI